ncbi:MerR family transcriptional regulator [Candidatus Parcubacteria bacterium]|nr:MAG: MerR family transcriptional regulator [Candidatus Parcubacteria bacterium]
MAEERIYRLIDLTKRLDRDKSTLLRWEQEGKIPRAARDNRGWRYYTQADFDSIVRLAEEHIFFHGEKDSGVSSSESERVPEPIMPSEAEAAIRVPHAPLRVPESLVGSALAMLAMLLVVSFVSNIPAIRFSAPRPEFPIAHAFFAAPDAFARFTTTAFEEVGALVFATAELGYAFGGMSEAAVLQTSAGVRSLPERTIAVSDAAVVRATDRIGMALQRFGTSSHIAFSPISPSRFANEVAAPAPLAKAAIGATVQAREELDAMLREPFHAVPPMGQQPISDRIVFDAWRSAAWRVIAVSQAIVELRFLSDGGTAIAVRRPVRVPSSPPVRPALIPAGAHEIQRTLGSAVAALGTNHQLVDALPSANSEMTDAARLSAVPLDGAALGQAIDRGQRGLARAIGAVAHGLHAAGREPFRMLGELGIEGRLPGMERAMDGIGRVRGAVGFAAKIAVVDIGDMFTRAGAEAVSIVAAVPMAFDRVADRVFAGAARGILRLVVVPKLHANFADVESMEMEFKQTAAVLHAVSGVTGDGLLRVHDAVMRR